MRTLTLSRSLSSLSVYVTFRDRDLHLIRCSLLQACIAVLQGVRY
jgi:hypothetical protein